jgi:hypothetical protein
MGDPPGEMSAEIRDVRPVLRCRAVSDTVRQNRLERIKFPSWDIRPDVDDHSGHCLTVRATEHAPFSAIDMKTLLRSN